MTTATVTNRAAVACTAAILSVVCGRDNQVFGVFGSGVVVAATSTAPDSSTLRARVFLWVSENPGADAEDVAHQFGISLADAVDITERLLQDGLLDFA